MTQIFVSIPTNDLERAKAFYTALGAPINPQYTDENAACFAWDDNVFLMVLARDFFATFTEKQITDPKVAVQTSINFTRESRDEVDAIVERGLANGGTEPRPAEDLGFMYSRDLEDPDGNNLGFLYATPQE